MDPFWIRPVMAITASGQPESGRIRFAGYVFPHTIRIRIGWFFSGTGSSPDHHYRIRFCTDRDHVRHFYSGPDGHRSIRIGSVFVQIETTSGISTPGRVVIDRSESDPFLYIWPVPISMRYPGSAWTERSQIRPASGEIETTSGISIPGRMVINLSESDPFLYIWPGSNIDALSRIRLDWTKPDRTRLQRNRSGPHPAFVFRAGWSLTSPKRMRFIHLARFLYPCVILRNINNVKWVVCFGIISLYHFQCPDLTQIAPILNTDSLHP